MKNWSYGQPQDKNTYPNTPGCLRNTYPTVTFWENEAAIAYDYGYGAGKFEKSHATKLKIVSLDWLYGGQ